MNAAQMDLLDQDGSVEDFLQAWEAAASSPKVRPWESGGAGFSDHDVLAMVDAADDPSGHRDPEGDSRRHGERQVDELMAFCQRHGDLSHEDFLRTWSAHRRSRQWLSERWPALRRVSAQRR